MDCSNRSVKWKLPVIRTAIVDDKAAIIALAEAISMFEPQDLELLEGMLAEYFSDNIESDRFWVVDDDGGLVGVAYCAPELYAMGTWNLYFIAVRPERQREGRGAKLLHYVEQKLRARGERLLLIETSGLPSFERVRAFYRKHGYEEEARIREFYKTGDDKIVFRKVLTASMP